MAVPSYQDLMLPVLKLASDGREHAFSEAIDSIARQLNISEGDRQILLPSGKQTQLYNRVTWAITYLCKALLLDRTGRGRFKIAPRGVEVLNRNPARVDSSFLEQFEEYLVFRAKKNKGAETDGTTTGNTRGESDVTPDERLDAAYRELRETLADDLLERVRKSTPRFFEHLVVDLLVAMGYGGTQTSAQVVGKSGDGGIDGVIPEDKLGLDMVYVQAKKWENSVGPDEIRKFVGSLGERKAHKGVFITSGTFTSGAHQAAEKANARIVLIDGEHLAELMIDHGIGVANQKEYVVKKVDSDYDV